MNAFENDPDSLRPKERHDAMLNAAVVLRDVSLLRPRNRCVSLGCRAMMRQHALDWRKPFPTAAGARLPSVILESSDAVIGAA